MELPPALAARVDELLAGVSPRELERGAAALSEQYRSRRTATLREEDATLKEVLGKIAPTVRYFANATGNGAWADLWLKDPAIPPDDASCRLGGC